MINRSEQRPKERASAQAHGREFREGEARSPFSLLALALVGLVRRVRVIPVGVLCPARMMLHWVCLTASIVRIWTSAFGFVLAFF